MPVNDDGLQVLMNGQIAPLVAAQSSIKSRWWRPAGIPSNGTVLVQVVQNGNAVDLPVAAQAAAPAIVTTSGLAYGDALVFNQDGTANSHANPAAPGSVVTLYMTGLGATNPLLQAGTVASGPGTLAAGASLSVTLYQSTCTVEYAGPAPGELAGIYQVNVQGTCDGDHGLGPDGRCGV